MAKKTKEPKATKSKVAKPVDPVKTRSLLRLISTLAALLAIAAFLLQLFAVLTTHWKWQSTALQPLVSPGYHYAQPNIQNDSQLYQSYGLWSRDVKVYANNDEPVNLWASTRFPRVDDGEDNYNYCLTRTSTLRGALLTCKNEWSSPDQCHCRRYAYWNWVIFFEVVALVLLGLVVFLVALQSTDLGAKLRPVAAGLAFLAFLFLLIGLLLIVTHLKRETRSFADAYPHINRRVTDQLGTTYNNQNRPQQAYRNSPYRRAVHRRAPEHYRAYTLLPGQHAYNDTHFQEYSDQQRSWVYKPYAGLSQPGAYVAPLQKQSGSRGQNATTARTYSRYGPVIGYEQVYNATRAGIGRSTVLSILATLLSLLLPLLLAFALLTSKKLGPTTTTTTKTTTTVERQGYVAVPTNPPTETSATRTLPTTYDPTHPVGEAVIRTQNVPLSYGAGGKSTDITHDVVIPDPGSSVTRTVQKTSTPGYDEASQTTPSLANP